MEKVKHKRKEGVIVGYRNNQLATIDSREIAEMLGKEHSELLKEIEGRKDNKNVGIIPILEKGNFHLSNYFIPSTYRAGTREYKCYLVTKMGCELLGNKQQGEKGILFTARYVERFNEMEVELNKQDNIYPELTPEIRAIFILDSRTKQLQTEFNEYKDNQELSVADSKRLTKLVNKTIVNLLGGKGSEAYKKLNKKAFSDLYKQIHREFNVTSIAEIKQKDIEIAREIISKYKAPIFLINEIKMMNNQETFSM